MQKLSPGAEWLLLDGRSHVGYLRIVGVHVRPQVVTLNEPQ